jgi:hypothetical protein
LFLDMEFLCHRAVVGFFCMFCCHEFKSSVITHSTMIFYRIC